MSAATYSEVRLTQAWKGRIYSKVQVFRLATSWSTFEMYLMMMEDEMLFVTGFLHPDREWSAEVIGSLFGEVSVEYDDQFKQGIITELTPRQQA